MAIVRMLVELDYDNELHHGKDVDAIDWFVKDVLLNTTEDGRLILYSNELGDEVGTVRVLKIFDPSMITYTAEGV